jgi:hypothetical protein
MSVRSKYTTSLTFEFFFICVIGAYEHNGLQILKSQFYSGVIWETHEGADFWEFVTDNLNVAVNFSTSHFPIIFRLYMPFLSLTHTHTHTSHLVIFRLCIHTTSHLVIFRLYIHIHILSLTHTHTHTHTHRTSLLVIIKLEWVYFSDTHTHTHTQHTHTHHS